LSRSTQITLTVAAVSAIDRGMRALLEGAKSGKFDCVIAESLDRLNDARVKLGLQIGKATRCPQMALNCRAGR
jgi:hypothetical protein